MAFVSDGWLGLRLHGADLRDGLPGRRVGLNRALWAPARWLRPFAFQGSNAYMAAVVLEEVLALAVAAAQEAAWEPSSDRWANYDSGLLRQLYKTVRAYRRARSHLAEEAERVRERTDGHALDETLAERGATLESDAARCEKTTSHSRVREFAGKLNHVLASWQPVDAPISRESVDVFAATPELLQGLAEREHAGPKARKPRRRRRGGTSTPWTDVWAGVKFVDRVHDLAHECFADVKKRDFTWADSFEIACAVRRPKSPHGAAKAAVVMGFKVGIYKPDTDETLDAAIDDRLARAFPSGPGRVGRLEGQLTDGAQPRPAPGTDDLKFEVVETVIFAAGPPLVGAQVETG